MSKQPTNNILGTESIPRLLLKYALPSVLSMLATALYNIVDQIYIGWGVGFLGNGATTIAFPLVTVTLAISLLIGNGSAAFISLEMGRGNTENVKKTIGNAFVLTVGSGVVLAALPLLFLHPILNALSTTEAVMPYAIDYVVVMALGFPFSMISTGLSAVIRADGSPRYSMVATMFGCVLNVILDPIFIFVFDMGVKGAAIATVLSQVMSAILIVVYLIRRANYARLDRKHLRVNLDITKKISAYGSSSFITQIAISAVNMVLNNALIHYGALSPYGSDIPLSAMGIVMKINAILISTILGISIGIQPVLGFNYGAGNFRRVRRTYLTGITITFSISIVIWFLFMTMPQIFIRVFGDTNQQFNDFAAKCLTTFMSAVFFAGIQIPSSNYFQAVGKPLKAMTLSMSRQLLLLVPAILILPRFFGLEGILYAAPVADVLALLITSFFIIRELRHLSAGHPATGGVDADESLSPVTERQPCADSGE